MIPHGLRFMAAFVVFSLAQELFGQSFLTEVSEVVHASVIPPFLAGFKSRPQAIIANFC